MNQLLVLTNKLMNTLDDLLTIFNNGETPSKEESFFRYVQEETNLIFSNIEAWERFAIQAVNEQKVSIRLEQITSTKDNITALILHSYYKDVRRRRYMEINKSCRFIFQQILKEYRDEKSTDSRS